jgi:hypothetical protein
MSAHPTDCAMPSVVVGKVCLARLHLCGLQRLPQFLMDELARVGTGVVGDNLALAIQLPLVDD